MYHALALHTSSNLSSNKVRAEKRGGEVGGKEGGERREGKGKGAVYISKIELYSD